MNARRYEFDVPGVGIASFRHRGRGKPSAAFCQAMHYLACAAMAQMGIEARACDPRVGDRFIGLDGTTIVEVTNIWHLASEHGSFPDTGDGSHIAVEYRHSSVQDELPACYLFEYRDLIITALQGGHTFHAVEDDEE